MPQANVIIQNKAELTWNVIPWREVNRRVNALRQRIYRATVEGDLKRVRNLQKLMMNSQANALISIRRVTQTNEGKRTPGVDKVVIKTDKERRKLYQQLTKVKSGKVYPIKRVYIPKKGGKSRPLGLPTILDRCRQAMVKSALEPYWEAKFERTSYGFRPGRSAQDAIQKIFCVVRPGKTRTWVLDADIQGAFDNIDHDYLLKRIGNFPGRTWIKQWLKSGVMENNIFTFTWKGTPQGGIISPLLANIALHGMEAALDVKYDSYGRTEKQSPYIVVRYADDFLVFARSKEECEKAQSVLNTWLAKRGLSFSVEKTRIRHITNGIDFLGFNIKQYATKSKKRGFIILIKPSKESVQAFKKQIKQEWRKSLGWETEAVIRNLNPKIQGWGNYYRTGASKSTFSKLDHWMWKRQANFVIRRHPNKYWWWRRRHYWGTIFSRKDRWVFKDKKSGIYLWKMAWIPIKRHALIKGNASPDNPNLKEYWGKRQASKPRYLFKKLSILWRIQKGKCPLCDGLLDNGEIIHTHHILPKKQGGKDRIANLRLLHATCHRQVHSKHAHSTGANKLLEPYAR